MSMIYMLADMPAEGEMYQVGPDAAQVANAWQVGEQDGRHVVLLACQPAFAEAMMASADYLGGNSADLALRFPEIARRVLLVDVLTADGQTVPVAFGDLAQGMNAVSPARPPIVIMGENFQEA